MYWNYDNAKKYVDTGGWIVTLDVLKYLLLGEKSGGKSCWIVTLDVLKFFEEFMSRTAYIGWIVTLDVLKCDSNIGYGSVPSVE